jgi:alpha-glucosidase
VLLLHPPIAPWLVRTADGCRVALLCRGVQPRIAYLRVEPDNEELLIAMQPTGSVNGLTRYEAELRWDTGNPTTHYAFKVIHDRRQTWLAADGLHPYPPPRELHFKVSRDHAPPDWVADQIVYQIFPDRFCQGDPSIAVATDEYVYGSGRMRVVREPWGAPIDGSIGPTAFYGGDLIGVRRQLPYLADELGVTALYLNPIFTSGSNHKYDTEDYDHVDPHLGGNAALAELAGALRERGMRLVLDAVINHTGVNHRWFDRLGRHGTAGAYQSADSPWRSWYVFGELDYASWKGHASLPVLDFSEPAVRAAIYGDRDSVLRRWLRAPYAIDGWRFDVIHMLGEGPGAHNNAHHVREMRRAVREENPEAYVMGEHFSEATRWLQGEQEDGAMNYYGFAHPVRAWLAERDLGGEPAQLTGAELEAWLTAARARVPYRNQLAQLSLIDSHDTVRFLTAVDGDAARMALAVTLLFTYPGVPCVYYGDEIGIEGDRDPDCRRCFDWDRSHWNAALHAHYRRMIAWRKARPEWRRGAYQTLATTDDALVFARYTERSVTVVAVNRGAEPAQVGLPLADLPLEAVRWWPAELVAGDGARAAGGVAPAEITIPARGSALVFGEA